MELLLPTSLLKQEDGKLLMTRYYGSLKVHQQLLEDGYQVCVNSVQKYRKELGLKAILAVRPPNMSQPIKEHKKYTYKLRGIDISSLNIS